MKKLDGLSLDLEKQNIDKLKELFPIAVEEGKINFDLLRAILGDEVDDSKEKYQFTWKGKSESIKLAQTPSAATLRPCKDKSKDWDSTDNLYIEGDNLEVLKQLQKTYYGKIKMIYIDPPYNTGNDFVYEDNFKDSLENYKKQTNQMNSANPETNGKFHTKWLNLIYPRLILAKNLLKDDGFIFISIDDKEVANLKMVSDEIFGSDNFVAQIAWKRKKEISNDSNNVSIQGEYLMCYRKDKGGLLNYEPLSEEYLKKSYNEPCVEYPLGKWRPVPLTVSKGLSGGGYEYEITTPSGYKHKRLWAYPKESFQKLVTEGLVYYGKNGSGVPQRVMYAKDSKGQPTTNYWDTVSTNKQGKKEILELFGDNYFETPKPVPLIKKMISLATNRDSLILDFFSGSATTAHAVMKLNIEDGGNRKFIMVQLPELCDEKKEAYKAGYKNICEIGEERIRLAGEQIKHQWQEEHPGEEFNTDIGFKVFELDSTNIIPWDDTAQYNESNLFELSEVFKKDRTKEDILYEIMLKYGIFDKKVEQIDVNGKTMFRIGRRYMVICLEDNVNSEDVKAIGKLGPRVVVFKEDGFINDNAKINATYNLEKYGVEDIKCI